jgi:hypothetical protein
MTLLAPLLLSAAVIMLGACSDAAAPPTMGTGDMDLHRDGGRMPGAGEGGASVHDAGSKLDAALARDDSAVASRDAAVADAAPGRDGSVVVPPSGRDVFGVTELFPTVSGGLEWDARYWSGEPHMVDFGTADPADPHGLANQRGDGVVTVVGDGTLRMTGNQPRIYLGTANDHPWLNVEVTVYYQRVEDDDTPYAGLVVGARSGPNGHGGDNCTATTYYARFRNDGDADVEKELEHPAAQPRETTPLWSGDDPPHDTWIGMKFVVRNVAGGEHVRLQVFRDLTEGEDGGAWEPIIDYTDSGGWNPPHDCDYAGDLIVTQGGGVVLIRNTGVIGQGALYKWLTVREIAPP